MRSGAFRPLLAWLALGAALSAGPVPGLDPEERPRLERTRSS